MDPKITFRSLAYTDIETLLNCFNESFKNYYVPLQLIKEQLVGKLYAEAIDMKLSFGAFEDDNLVAFILHGIDSMDDKRVAYNGGTGVLPPYRGKQLSYTLYEYVLQQLKNNRIKKSILEVIDLNIPAIKTYERIGFIKTRKLVSYKGKPDCKKDTGIQINTLLHPDWNMVNDLCDWQRSWQYNNHTLQRGWDNYLMLTAGEDEAYCIANLKNGRVAHFGNRHKNNDRLFSLFAHVAENTENPLTLINIDEKAVTANSFVTSIGLQHLITSYEMEIDL